MKARPGAEFLRSALTCPIFCTTSNSRGLPGMPKEYHPYVYLLEEETADAIAEKLGGIFAQPADVLFEKGMAAREFILKEKNNVSQAGKILAMLKKDGMQ